MGEVCASYNQWQIRADSKLMHILQLLARVQRAGRESHVGSFMVSGAVQQIVQQNKEKNSWQELLPQNLFAGEKRAVLQREKTPR